MAHFINASSQNLTAAWPQVESNATQTSVAVAVNTTTSEVFGNTFTFVNNDVADGFLLYCKQLTTTGTVTVALNKNGVDQKTVVVNATDLPTNASWVFFKFGSTQTGDGASTWKIGVIASSTANATFNTASGTNWAVLLRLTSTASPVANDQLWIISELTGAGTSNLYTVTMDSVSSSPSYGDINICYKGKLQYGTTASTNYYLQITGKLWLWDTATLNIGTSGTPIPSTGSAILEFNCASAVQYGLEIQLNSIFASYGNALTFVQTKLTADAAASATSLTTADSTGWLNSDTIALAPTTRTASQSESKALTANASGTTLTIAAITNARSGTSPTQAELGNLTRNVKIRGVSAANTGYVNVAAAASYTSHYVEYTNLGSSTSLKRGIDAATSTGTFDFQYNSVHDLTVSSAVGINLNLGSSATSSSVNISNNIIYNTASNGIIGGNSGGYTISGNLLIKPTNAGMTLTNISNGTVLTNNTITGSTARGFNLSQKTAATTLGTINNLTAHTNGTTGILFGTTTGSDPLILTGTISTLTMWRNSTHGIQINGDPVALITLDTITLFGNTTAGITFDTVAYNISLNNITANGKITSGDLLTQASGFNFNSSFNSWSTLISLSNSTFGSSFTHSTGDININNSRSQAVNMTCQNCLFNSATVISSATTMIPGSIVGIEKNAQTTGNHITYKVEGNIQIDTTSTHFDVTPSEQLTNFTGNFLLKSSYVYAPVSSGLTLTIGVKIRVNSAAYTGNNPRVMLRKNIAIGISSDTVIDTMPTSYVTGGNIGTFYTSSKTTPAATDDGVMVFWVDAGRTDGTTNATGIVDVDSWSIS